MYEKDIRTIQTHLNNYTPPQKEHHPRIINLVVDATYFGMRKEHASWCVVVFRDPWSKENLWWGFGTYETTSIYRQGRKVLEARGYSIRSVTGDGFSGIRQAFSGIPFQMCHVHMERLVIKGTTRKPKTEAGRVLLALVKTLKISSPQQFHMRLLQYVQKYESFLSERTVHSISGNSSWTHEGVRHAQESLLRLQKYLFTYHKYSNIPRTTNSIEGHFSHIKDIVRVHRGISKYRLQKVLNSILLASSIAPNSKTLDDIL
jgi:hypothetical protein